MKNVDNYFGNITVKSKIDRYKFRESDINVLKEEIKLLKEIFKGYFTDIDITNINIENVDDILIKIKDIFEDILINSSVYKEDIYKFLTNFNRKNSLLLNILEINFDLDIYSIVEVVQSHIREVLDSKFSQYSEIQIFETKGYGFDFNLRNKKYFVPIYKFFIKGKKIEGIYDVRDFVHVYKVKDGYYFVSKKEGKINLYKVNYKNIDNNNYLVMDKVVSSNTEYVIMEDDKFYVLISNNKLLYLSEDGLEEYEIICKNGELLNYEKFIKSICKRNNIVLVSDIEGDKFVGKNKLIFEISDNYHDEGEIFEAYNVDLENKMIFIKKMDDFK